MRDLKLKTWGELTRQAEFLKDAGLKEWSPPCVGQVLHVRHTGDLPVWVILVRWHEDLRQFQACPISDFPIAAGPDVPLGNAPGYGDLIAHAGLSFWVGDVELTDHCDPVLQEDNWAKMVRQRLADMSRGREEAFPHEPAGQDWLDHIDNIKAVCSQWLQ